MSTSPAARFASFRSSSLRWVAFALCTLAAACADGDGDEIGGGNDKGGGGGDQGGDGFGGQPQGGQPQGGQPQGGEAQGGEGGQAQGGQAQGGDAQGGGGGNPDGLANGQPCDTDSDCSGNYCMTEAAWGIPGGQCSEYCDDFTPCTEAGNSCGYFNNGESLCLVDCDPLAANSCGTMPATIACVANDQFPLGGLCFSVCDMAGDCTIASNTCHDAPTGYCAPTEVCDNGSDDDLDLDVDCDDSDCAADATCTAACSGAIVAQATQSGDTTNGTHVFTSSCGGDGGEVVYTYTQGAAGSVRFALQSATDLGFSLRSTCADGSSETECVDVEIGGTDEVLIVPLAAGQVVSVIVDAYTSSDDGPYTLLIAPAIEACTNGTDDDGDELADCADSDCAADAGCLALCSGAPVAQATNAGDTSAGTASFDSSCASSFGDGGEVLYQYTAAATGVVRFDLSSDNDSVISFRSTCIDAASEISCTDDGFDSERVDLPMTAGQTVTVIVEAYDDFEEGGFTLNVIPAGPENCTDGLDTDFDGDVDCADSDCQGLPACTPGGGVINSTCSANNQCASSVGGDPVCATPALFENVSINAAMCTEWCDVVSNDCPAGHTCVDVGFNDGLCFKDCVDDAGCPGPFYCSFDEVCYADPPAGWMCENDFYNGDPDCDCGCGAFDPDCSSMNASVCEWCLDTGSCATTGCSDIDPTNNAICL